jgi:serine/threonine protein kinase
MPRNGTKAATTATATISSTTNPCFARDLSDTSTTATSTELSSKRSSIATIDSQGVDPRCTDLQSLHTHKVFDKLHPDLGGFTVIRKLAKGINGDIFEYCWRQAGSGGDEVERVAVKKLRNHYLDRDGTAADEREIHMRGSQLNVASAEDPLTEIGVLSYLSQQPDLSPNLLRLHKVFGDASDQFTWLVTELAEGGDMFDVAASSRRTRETDIRRYAQQLIGAVGYLHDHHIGHRDVSLENILLKDGCVKLMDFGMAVRSHSPLSGVELRYFRPVGKQSYRSPECYVPTTECVTVVPPADAVPGQVVMTKVADDVGDMRGGYICEVRLPLDVVPGKRCLAEVWGYSAIPADMFATGMCIFMLMYKCPPWQRAQMIDQRFAFAHGKGEKGLEELLLQWDKPIPSSENMQLLTSLLQTNPSKRPSASTSLGSSWLTGESAVQGQLA